MTLNVALTGSIASGKSSVAELWAAAGVPVASADDFARQAVAPGSPGLAAVRDAFGEAVLTPEGALDRAALRARVFRDGEARRRLEAIVHPTVRVLRDEWFQAQEAAGQPVAVSEIPLLFETGMEGSFDVTVLVDAPEEERLRRLVEDRGLDADEARSMMAAQLPGEEKRARADLVIDNRGELGKRWRHVRRRSSRS